MCGQFLFVRRVRIGEPFYASPFSTTAEQTTQLIDAAESKRPLTAIVRIEIREPDKNNGFNGFIVFQKKGEKRCVAPRPDAAAGDCFEYSTETGH